MGLQKRFQYGLAVTATVMSFNAVAAQPEYVPGEVLIIPDTSFQAASVQAHGMSVLKTHKGRTKFSTVKVQPGQTVAQAVQVLSNTPGVKYAQPNYIYYAAAVPNESSFSNYWGLQNTAQAVNGSPAGTIGADIGAVAAWDRLTDCSPVVIAVVDSGVDYAHSDLSSVIWSNAGEIAGNGIDDDGNGQIDDVRGWDFVQADNDPMDFYIHGTHVAGTIGASGNNSIGGVGVCWKSTIMPIRVLDSVGSGTTANIAAGVDYAVANGAKVINMSLGGTGGTDAPGDILYDSIAAANNSGVLVVAAAGNSSNNNDGGTHHYPSDYTLANIISVAATDQDDALASFSNFGATSVDVAAPGVNIYSTTPPARTAVPGCSWNFDDGTMQGWTGYTYDNSGTPLVAVTNTVAVTTEDATTPSLNYSLTDSPGGNAVGNRQYEGLSPACDLTGYEGAVYEFSFRTNMASTAEGFIPYIYDGASHTWVQYVGSFSWMADVHDMQAWDNTSGVRVGWGYLTDSAPTPAAAGDGVHIDDVAITAAGTIHGGTEYAFLSGTSMAAPHVSGVAALLWAARPDLTVSELRTLVINSGDTVPALATVTVSGKRINLNNVIPADVPTGLTATATSASLVTLNWTDNATTETSYEVWRDVGTGFTKVATLAADSMSYSDTTAPAETLVTYRVMAVETGVRTLASETASVTTLPAPPSSSSGGGGVWGAFLFFMLLPFCYRLFLLTRDKK